MRLGKSYVSIKVIPIFLCRLKVNLAIPVRIILERTGMKGPANVGSQDWNVLVKLLRKHGIKVSGNRVSIIDPFRKWRDDLA